MKKLWMIALAAMAFFACSDNSASSDQEVHFEADGWNLYWSDWELAYSVFQGKADSSLETLRVNANCLSEHIHVKFLNSSNEQIDPPTDSEHSLGWVVGDEKILDIEWEGGWGFHLKGVKEGSTTLQLQVKHHDHADVKTPEIKIVVDSALAAEKCPFQEDEEE
jgi:hypothetical protein